MARLCRGGRSSPFPAFRSAADGRPQAAEFHPERAIADLQQGARHKSENAGVSQFVSPSRAHVIRSVRRLPLARSHGDVAGPKGRPFAANREPGRLSPGSITTTTGRCGNPNCRCHRPNEPGHGPNFRLTYKAQGKSARQRSMVVESSAYRSRTSAMPVALLA
ncbi:MAG: DUF6788 family protein [Acidobacteriaceae bacterium]